MNRKINSISAIWYSNDKTKIEECTDRVLKFLILLKDYNSHLFGTWFEKANTKKEALEKKVEFNPAYIKDALDKKWDRKFDDIGSRISFWTGNTDENGSSEISFKVGGYGHKSFNKNSCVLTLPVNQSSEDKDRYIELVELFKSYWNPNKLLVNGEAVEDTYSRHSQ